MTKKRYIFSILPDKFDSSKIIIFEDDTLDKLNTTKEKRDAPLWNMSKSVSRSKNPTHVSGMIIDYDSTKLPLLNKQYYFYYHHTHSNKWRIIIPFDKIYRFTTTDDYFKNYLNFLTIMFQYHDESIDDLIKQNVIQKSCCTAVAFFFMRPKKNKLFTNEGERYKPLFQKPISIEELRKDLIKFSDKKPIFDVPHGTNILLRLSRFFDYYRYTLSWTFLENKDKRCVFEWHSSSHAGNLKFNNPTRGDFKSANIYCFQETCNIKLLEFMRKFQPVPRSEKDLVKPITDVTVLYLAAAVIKGIYSLDQIEACGLHNHRQMLYNLKYLHYIKLDPKIDCALFTKIVHDNVVIDPEDSEIYVYENGYYQKKDETLLKSSYHESIGTYVAYRCTTTKKLKSLTYINDFFEYSKGIMLANFKSMIMVDGLVLNNGVLLLDGDGSYHLTPHSPSYFSKIKSDIDYDDTKKYPLWEKTLCDYFDTLDSPQVMILQEYFGYALTYDRSFEKLLFLFGESRGGKNTVVQTLLSILPGSESSMYYLIKEDRRAPSIVDKKVVFVNEAMNLNNRATVSELKKMSSTDRVQIRYLHKNPYTTDKVPKVIIAFNEVPDNMKIDDALKNRMLTVKFTKSFVGKENKNLKNELLAERAGILNWMLAGYERLYRRGRFIEYITDSNELYETANEADFALIDFIKSKENGEHKARELYDDYRLFFEVPEKDMSMKKFGHMMRKLKYEKIRKSMGYVYLLNKGDA